MALTPGTRLGAAHEQRVFVVYPDDYDSDQRANVVALRNRAIVLKFNRLFRL